MSSPSSSSAHTAQQLLMHTSLIATKRKTAGNQKRDECNGEPEDPEDSELDDWSSQDSSLGSSERPSPLHSLTVKQDSGPHWLHDRDHGDTFETSNETFEREVVDERTTSTRAESLQLEVDLEVLAVHLQQQSNELELSQSMNTELRLEIQLMQERLCREMESVGIENDALRRQNAQLLAERDEQAQRAQIASETHTEMLSALRSQQQREDHARTIVTGLVKERDTLKKQLDDTRAYCRRLEEDVVDLRAEVQHLRTENKTIHVALSASTTQRSDRELKVIQEQQQLIESLRADLVQMEFEYKTLSVDKDKLSRTVSTLQRQRECRTTSYDVISLKADDSKKHTKKLSIITTSSKSKSADKGDEGFTNMMALPNAIDDGDSNTGTAAPRTRTPMGSLVSKTFFSAKKKLFSPPSHASTVVIPQ